MALRLTPRGRSGVPSMTSFMNPGIAGANQRLALGPPSGRVDAVKTWPGDGGRNDRGGHRMLQSNPEGASAGV